MTTPHMKRGIAALALVALCANVALNIFTSNSYGGGGDGVTRRRLDGTSPNTAASDSTQIAQDDVNINGDDDQEDAESYYFHMRHRIARGLIKRGYDRDSGRFKDLLNKEWERLLRRGERWLIRGLWRGD